ncbi:DUF4087 domain-containing protein [Mesorhizobium robiniae]|uniref:DUF4087 domain-containing protein n=1 Tax=Mesorhizobium robiniae TaxID=559315 RepID=UPI003397A77F
MRRPHVQECLKAASSSIGRDDRQFVETKVPGSGHGYGCACMTVVTNANQKRSPQ